MASLEDIGQETKYVQILVGKRSLDLAQKCIAKMPTLSQQPIALVVHSDGTLDSNDLAGLAEHTRIARVISAEEADEVVDNRLRHYPNCRRYRDFRFTGRIVFDVPLFAEKEMFFFDTDILFNKPFVLHHFWQERKYPFIFMQGTGNAYCLNPWQFTRFKFVRSDYRLHLRNRINAGIICMSKDYYDLDFLEYLLSQPIYERSAKASPFWWNQTTYALLAARYGCGVLDPDKVVNASIPGFSADKFMTYAAVHFTTPYRNHLEDCLVRMDVAPVRQPVAEISVVPARAYILAEAMLKSVWRKARVGEW